MEYASDRSSKPRVKTHFPITALTAVFLATACETEDTPRLGLEIDESGYFWCGTPSPEHASKTLVEHSDWCWKENPTLCKTVRWPTTEIAVKRTGFSTQSFHTLVDQALSHIEDVTILSFVPAAPTDTFGIEIVQGDDPNEDSTCGLEGNVVGFATTTGFLSRNNFVRVSICETIRLFDPTSNGLGGLWPVGQPFSPEYQTGLGTILHEIGHAIGMEHEFQRCDRDEYQSVTPDQGQNNYRTLGRFCFLGGQQHGGYASHDFQSYDFDSVMGYSSPSFRRRDGTCIHSEPPINPLPAGSCSLFPPTQLSATDEAKIDALVGSHEYPTAVAAGQLDSDPQEEFVVGLAQRVGVRVVAYDHDGSALATWGNVISDDPAPLQNVLNPGGLQHDTGVVDLLIGDFDHNIPHDEIIVTTDGPSGPRVSALRLQDVPNAALNPITYSWERQFTQELFRVWSYAEGAPFLMTGVDVRDLDRDGCNELLMATSSVDPLSDFRYIIRRFDSADPNPSGCPQGLYNLGDASMDPGTFATTIVAGDFVDGGDLEFLIGINETGVIPRMWSIRQSNIFDPAVPMSLGSAVIKDGVVAGGIRVQAADAADIDNDGEDEFALGLSVDNGSPALVIHEGHSGDWAEIMRITRDNGPGTPGVVSVDFGDFDDDGFPDMLLVNPAVNGSRLDLYRNNGTNPASFTLQFQQQNDGLWPHGHVATDAVFLDVNGDGDEELLVSRIAVEGSPSWLVYDHVPGTISPWETFVVQSGMAFLLGIPSP